jgi:hypothetical protein
VRATTTSLAAAQRAPADLQAALTLGLVGLARLVGLGVLGRGLLAGPGGPAERWRGRAGPRSGGGAGRARGAVAGPAPVFTTLAGGLGRLPPVLAGASGAEVRT